MDWLIVFGSLCLGVIIGALAAWYFSVNLSEEKMTAKVLVATTSALVGTSVMAMFSFLAGFRGPTREYWFYPIGLFIGFVAVAIIEYIHFDYTTGEPRKAKQPSQRKR
jgi:heme/copper-type cytochrome/quinol oxidase subunit 3